ncbi:MAG: hypothetical protein JST54_11975 [Deltaproteobacteria bacterium]|nr:hypothetical protein [Deltaproteobacteria bacterium]
MSEVDCATNVEYGFECSQGNCRCLINEQEVQIVQLPGMYCGGTEWNACGFPANDQIAGALPVPSMTDAGLGGAASVQGLTTFEATSNGYQLTDDGTESHIDLALAQNGLCQGYEATGPWILMRLVGASPLAPQTFTIIDGSETIPYFTMSLNEWDDDAGIYGSIGWANSGNVTVDRVDGGLSGSFDVTLSLNDGGSAALQGSFADVPACTHE